MTAWLFRYENCLLIYCLYLARGQKLSCPIGKLNIHLLKEEITNETGSYFRELHQNACCRIINRQKNNKNTDRIFGRDPSRHRERDGKKPKSFHYFLERSLLSAIKLLRLFSGDSLSRCLFVGWMERSEIRGLWYLDPEFSLISFRFQVEFFKNSPKKFSLSECNSPSAANEFPLTT